MSKEFKLVPVSLLDQIVCELAFCDARHRLTDLLAAAPQPPALGGEQKIQVMGRVWHLLEGNVSAVLNSVGRELPDDTRLVSLDDHRAHIDPLQAEIERLSAENVVLLAAGEVCAGAIPLLDAARHERDQLKSDIQRLKAELPSSESDSREQSAEIDQLTAQRDELLDLLLVLVTQHDLPIAARDLCNAALSKPAGIKKA